jgi:hypothetical protein
MGGCSMVRGEYTARRFRLRRGLVGEKVAVFPGVGGVGGSGGKASCKRLMAVARSSLFMAVIIKWQLIAKGWPSGRRPGGAVGSRAGVREPLCYRTVGE